ncbi:MAG: hypothetical protein EA384_09630 [Spirochaetaceae bacterium]|nr:MAG: hypothetical protein EA384_09630 [Spirochaetaceae bacterium]
MYRGESRVTIDACPPPAILGPALPADYHGGGPPELLWRQRAAILTTLAFSRSKPRTVLRYAIEHFEEAERRAFLCGGTAPAAGPDSEAGLT